MRKNNGSPKRAIKRQRKQAKRRNKKIEHREFLWKTFRKYGNLEFKYQRNPGEKYLQELLESDREKRNEEVSI